MEEIRFNWVSNELLTKKRMDQFTDFLHQRFGYLHTLNKGDYGYGLQEGQQITFELSESNIKITLPPMRIIFPNGFLITIPKPVELPQVEKQNKLLCFGLSNEGIPLLHYFDSEKEPLEKNYLPLLNPSKSEYLKPVLQIKIADEYKTILLKLDQSVNNALQLINKYFLENQNTTSQTSALRQLIFQSILSALQAIQFSVIINPDISSVNYFNHYKPVLLLISSYKEYFDKMDSLSGLHNNYSQREKLFISALEYLTGNLNFLHANENVNQLSKWMENFVNRIEDYAIPDNLNSEKNNRTETKLNIKPDDKTSEERIFS